MKIGTRLTLALSSFAVLFLLLGVMVVLTTGRVTSQLKDSYEKVKAALKAKNNA